MSNKLFCYVDESGQDTRGEFFIVGIVVVESQREEIRAICETIERQSGKHRLKWYESSQRTRIAYIHAILTLLPAEAQLCFAHYHDSLDYFVLTVDAIANTVQRAVEISSEQTEPKVTALIDGLPKSQERIVGSLLRKRGVRIDKVRGVKRDENDVLIRLADALCGFVRQAMLNVPEAQAIFEEYSKSGRLQDVTNNQTDEPR